MSSVNSTSAFGTTFNVPVVYMARDVMMKANSFQGQLEGAHTKSNVLIFKTCQKNIHL